MLAPPDLTPVGVRVATLVVLENELVRHGVLSMLGDLPRVAEAWSCGGAEEGLRLLAVCRPDLVLCHGGSRHAPALLQAARDAGARTLVLLDGVELAAVDRAVLNAAHGFLLQGEMTVPVLAEAVERVGRGDLSLPDRLARALVTRLPAAAPRTLTLTPRERQVLQLLAEGLSNKQVARRLAISEHGVKRHVANLLAKLHSPNRTLAVALALREGLVTTPEGD